MEMFKRYRRVFANTQKKREKISLMISAHVIACLLLFALAAVAFEIQGNFIQKWQGKESITTISIVGTEIEKE